MERSLDCIVARILEEPTKKYFDIFDRAIQEMDNRGYAVSEYREISKTLRREYL